MPSLNPVRRYQPLLYAAAFLLAALTILYTAAWMYYVRLSPQVEIGIDETYSSAGVEIGSVHKDGPRKRLDSKRTTLSLPSTEVIRIRKCLPTRCCSVPGSKPSPATRSS